MHLYLALLHCICISYYCEQCKTHRFGWEIVTEYGDARRRAYVFPVARTHKARKEWKCTSVLTRVLPGCVWDWSHPTLWLLLREIPRADWCLVARRLGHLGRGRHCWGRILIWVTAMGRKVQGNIRSGSNHFTVSLSKKNNNHKNLRKSEGFL